MVYLLLYPRPLGPEPKLYLTRPPEAVYEEFEVEPGHFMSDPWGDYEIVEFNSEFLARQWLKEHYPMTYEELVNLSK